MSATIAHVTTRRDLRSASPRPAPAHLVLAGSALLVVTVVLTAVNLRPTVTSMGALLDQVRAALGASPAWASVLTTAPPLCFAAAGVFAPWVRRRIGMVAGVGSAVLVLAVGLAVRVLDGQAVVLVGTFVACFGIAVGNVLIPVVIKESFPARVGLLTGVYTAGLQGGAALGSALTPALEQLLGGWRAALGAWAVLAVLALVSWLLVGRLAPRRPLDDAPDPRHGPVAAGNRTRSLLRSPIAWQVTAFFGLQSFGAYTVMGWLPALLIDTAGTSRQVAGLLLGLVSVLAVPTSLVVAPLAAKRHQQSGWIVGIVACGVVGVLGLLLAPAALPVVWSVFLGVGLSVFSLVLTLLSLRTRDAKDTARLSGMAQGLGYLFASLGPLLFGLLHGITGGWHVSLTMFLVVLCVELLAGWLAGRPRFV
jgi:CP family cyanate transporter-like MFS transporter